MDYFTLITGIAGLIGFAIQLFDVFPGFARLRGAVVLLLVGVFIGSLLRAFDASRLRVDITITFGMAVVLLAAVALGILLIAALTSSDHRRRGELYGVSGFAFGFFLITLFAYAVSSSPSSIHGEKQRLSITELSLLADRAAERGDFERALMHLDSVKNRLELKDERLPRLQERIRELQRKQIP